MARYDKYEPIAGGFRAPLNADLTPLNASGDFGPKGVSLNDSGRVVVGTGGTTGLVGVLVKNAPRQAWGPTTVGPYGTTNPAAPMGLKAGDIVDVMTNGEIVDLAGSGITGLAAGQPIYTTAAGDLTNVATGNTKIGYTVEADRLVVRVAA
jgi:hypothetical protein